MNYRKCAEEIYAAVGEKGNIVSAAHCATRLRLVIGDNAKCSKEKLENVDGVKGVFEASGQLQIILGTGVVNKVYDEFLNIAGIEGGSKEEVKQAASAKQNWFKRAIKTLGDIFVPIIPAIVASGLLMGVLEGLTKVWPDMANSGTYTIFHLFSSAAFTFLPILIAISTARVFGGNIFLGAVIGMIMIHPDLLNAWSVATAETVPSASAWFGLYNVDLVGYQGHVIPIVISVWLMCVIEKKLHKIVPEMIDLFVTPFVSVLVTGYVALTIIGPIFAVIENYVLQGAQYLITIPFGIGSAIVGALYGPTVVAGVHHMYNAIEAGLLSSTGINIWMPIATAANVAQAGAALAVGIKTKNKKIKSMALPASLSAFLGITEPAIFGVNIRFFKSFIAGCIGGAVGALFAGIMHIGATAYGVTGIFGLLITTDYTFSYIILMLISTAVAFALSWLFYKDEPAAEVANGETKGIKEDTETNTSKSIAETSTGSTKKNTADSAASHDAEQNEVTYDCPIPGEVIALAEVPDETFAAGILGDGIGVKPSEGKVYAPCDAVVENVFDTKHALGLKTADSVELLIHVGLDTVSLNGAPFTTCVEAGAKVAKGDLLVEFDMDKITEAGLSTVSVVIVTEPGKTKQVNFSQRK